MPSENEAFHAELGEINLPCRGTSGGVSADYRERKLIWLV